MLLINTLKNFNEALYSDNCICRDVKEKVIGKTCEYRSGVKELAEEVIRCSKSKKGHVSKLGYKEFLQKYVLLNVDRSIKCRKVNLRVILTWVVLFYKIYEKTE